MKRRTFNGELLDVRAASTRWAGRNGSLRGFVAHGLVPYRKLGSRVVFRRSELEQWIENLPGVSLKDAELNRKARGS